MLSVTAWKLPQLIWLRILPNILLFSTSNGNPCCRKSCQHIQAHENLRRQRDLILSIPGIGEKTAVILLAEIGDINIFKSARQLAAHAGLIPIGNEAFFGSVQLIGENPVALKGSLAVGHPE